MRSISFTTLPGLGMLVSACTGKALEAVEEISKSLQQKLGN